MKKLVILITFSLAGLLIASIFHFDTRNACINFFNLTWFSQQYAGVCARFEPQINKTAHKAEIALKPKEERFKFKGLSKMIPGPPTMLAWANNTNGQWDLYLRKYGGEVHRLTNTEEDELFPRISPNGEWLFFIRHLGTSSYLGRFSLFNLKEDSLHINSVEFISFIDHHTALIDPLDPETGKRHIRKMDIRTGKQSDNPINYLPQYKSINLHQPAANKGKNLMYILVNRLGWRVEMVNLVNGNTREIGSGCRPSTAFGSELMAMTSNRGNGQSSIVIHNYKTGDIRTIVDMPGPVSHEYDGTLSSDGKWLLFTVSPNNQTIAENGANYRLYACPIKDCSNPEIILDMPGADSFPYLHVLQSKKHGTE